MYSLHPMSNQSVLMIYSSITLLKSFKKLVQRNRCNLNDYQNQANNGCKAKYMAEKSFLINMFGETSKRH